MRGCSARAAGTASHAPRTCLRWPRPSTPRWAPRSPRRRRSRGASGGRLSGVRDGGSRLTRFFAGPFTGSPREEYDLHGMQEDEHIEKDRHVLDVVEVVLQLFPCVLDGGAVGVSYLSPSGDARLHREAVKVERHLLRELGHERDPLGSWPYQAHVTQQDVEE